MDPMILRACKQLMQGYENSQCFTMNMCFYVVSSDLKLEMGVPRCCVKGGRPDISSIGLKDFDSSI
jgi:hypothetical protein